MRSRTVALMGLCALMSACSMRTLGNEGSEASDAEETVESGSTVDDEISGTTGETSGTTDDTAGVDESCTCIESRDLMCDLGPQPMALRDCDVPSPCERVDLDAPDAEIASCILQLLIDQDQPSQFDYIARVAGGWGDDVYRGTFFVLSPNAGVDLECLSPSYDCCAPPPEVPTPAFHELEDPAYFEDCLGKTASVMTGCIFNGVHAMGMVPECAGP